MREQEEAKEQLASYQAIAEWLKSAYHQAGWARADRDKLEQLEQILDLCADLVMADIRDWEDIVAQIEEALR